LAFVLAIPALPALAQEPVGAFTGTFNGTPITCQFRPSQSDFVRTGNTLTISIMTNPCEGFEDRRWIALSFEQTGESIGSVEIDLSGLNDVPKLYGKTDTGATVDLLSASEEGDFLTLSGEVSAQIGPSEDRGGTIDLSAPQALDGSLSGVIGRLSF